MKFKAPGRTKKNKSKSNEEAVAAALAEPAPEEVSPPAEESEEVKQDAVPAETTVEEEAVSDQGAVGDTIIEESEGQISVTEASSEDRGLKIDIPKMFLSPFCGFYLFHRL